MLRKRLLAELRVEKSKVALKAPQGDIFEESAFAPPLKCFENASWPNFALKSRKWPFGSAKATSSRRVLSHHSERWMLTEIDDVRAPEEVPPLGRVRWEYLLLDPLSHEQGNLFRLWYEDPEDHERSFWHAFMPKASEKQEHRKDFGKEFTCPNGIRTSKEV